MRESPKPHDFTVVVITRNRPTILEQCLQHLAEQSHAPGAILVIDSSDTFVPVVKQGVEHVHFPPGRQQMPRARNEGIRRAKTSHIAFVDDDCLVDSDWLYQLLVAYEQNPLWCGVGGRITDARWPYLAELPVGHVTHEGRVISNFFGDPGGITEVQILPGGNMSFGRAWLISVGGFDPNYIATNHREDPDLCLRLAQRGGRLAYQPAAHALHLNARNALGELRPWHEGYLRFSFGRNEGFFLSRHFPRVLLKRWMSDTISQVGRAWRDRSFVDGFCTGIQAISFGLGMLSYVLWGQRPRFSSDGPPLLQGGCLF